MTIHNKSSSPDHLIRATSPLAARVEMHVHLHDGDVMRMRQVKGYDLPAKGSLELKPGIAHLMFVDIKQPFKEGEKIPVTLRFERAGEVTVTFTVDGLTCSISSTILEMWKRHEPSKRLPPSRRIRGSRSFAFS